MLSLSAGIVLSWFRDNHKQDEIPPSAPFNWVDARDGTLLPRLHSPESPLLT
jgi:hypothetical protein